MPALYLSNYSASLALVDYLSLVRPDQSYRNDRDLGCQAALGNDAAVYMVYTLEEGDDRYICMYLVCLFHSFFFRLVICWASKNTWCYMVIGFMINGGLSPAYVPFCYVSVVLAQKHTALHLNVKKVSIEY